MGAELLLTRLEEAVVEHLLTHLEEVVEHLLTHQEEAVEHLLTHLEEVVAHPEAHLADLQTHLGEEDPIPVLPRHATTMWIHG